MRSTLIMPIAVALICTAGLTAFALLPHTTAVAPSAQAGASVTQVVPSPGATPHPSGDNAAIATGADDSLEFDAPAPLTADEQAMQDALTTTMLQIDNRYLDDPDYSGSSIDLATDHVDVYWYGTVPDEVQDAVASLTGSTGVVHAAKYRRDVLTKAVNRVVRASKELAADGIVVSDSGASAHGDAVHVSVTDELDDAQLEHIVRIAGIDVVVTVDGSGQFR